MQAAIRGYHNGAIPTTLESCQSIACYLPIIRYVSIWILAPFFTLYYVPNLHLYFIIIRHFLYYYLNWSYPGNSWTSGLPIRQSFYAVNSGLYLCVRSESTPHFEKLYLNSTICLNSSYTIHVLTYQLHMTR